MPDQVRHDGNRHWLAGFDTGNNQGAHVKGVGYLISILSVFLLAAGSLKTASQDPLLLLCLIAGMTTSIVGMGLRYWSYRREQAEERA
jgi:hypothetical protein